MDRQSGDLILGTYHVESIISGDDIQTLFYAQGKDGLHVVVREFRLKKLPDWNYVKKIENEARTREKLKHSGLVRFVGLFTEELDDDASYYLISEKAMGQSVGEVVEAEGALEYSRTTNYITQLLKTFSFLHSQDPRIVLGKVTSDEIIVDEKGMCRIADLCVDSDLKLQNPERVGSTQPAADIRSLGMLAIYMLTGKNPLSLPTTDYKPQYFRRGQKWTTLDYVIDRMLGPDPMSADQLLDSLQKPQPDQSNTLVATINRASLRINPSSGVETLVVTQGVSEKPESLLLTFLLDIWVTKPWLVIIIVALLSAGPAVIPLLILYGHPRSRSWINRLYSRHRHTSIRVVNDRISVSDQLEPTKIADLDNISYRQNGSQLEITFRRSNGKEISCYLSNLTDADMKIAIEYLNRNLPIT